VLEESGYPRITDFGISRPLRENNSKENSGTPGYMAPEVLNHQNWDYSVDFYALGVILYEFIMKKKPYKGKTRKEIKDQVMAKEAFIDKKDLPKNWSENARDLVNKLLVRNPEDRIGYLGIEEIFTHSWFDDMEWDKLENKELSKVNIII